MFNYEIKVGKYKKQITLPKKYISYSALFLWEKNKDDYRRRYYENIKLPDTEYTLFGKEVHALIDKDSKYKNIRLSESEHKIEYKIKGVPILAYIDTFCPKTCAFGEYKTGIKKPDGSPRWTQMEVYKLKQLPLYALLIWRKYGVRNKETYLVWLETKFKTDEIKKGNTILSVGKKLVLTGYRKIFYRTIYKYQMIAIENWIIKNTLAISNDYKLWLNKHTMKR